MNDLQWYLDIIKNILKDNRSFTGSLNLNFFKGNVSNINKVESIKKEDKKINYKDPKVFKSIFYPKIESIKKPVDNKK